MSSESASEPGVPAVAPARRTLAERFSSFTEYAEYTVATPQSAAISLDVARFHAFTGELSFSTDPAVLLYLDGGSVYHAERVGDPSISQTLADAGVVEAAQMQRGVVRVGDVEHLGRLFDRDTSIDRDAVMVLIESRTDAIVHELANAVVASVSVSAYRHHPSGIHRWFVAPAEPSTSQFPVSGFAQVDRSVVDDLPGLDAAASLRIEWSDPDPSGLGVPANVPSSGESGARVDIQAELDRFDADQADWTAAAAVSDEAMPSPLGDFHIVWPDGTEDAPIVEASAEPASASPMSAPPMLAPIQPTPDLPAPLQDVPTLLPLAPPAISLTTPPVAAPRVSRTTDPVPVAPQVELPGTPAFSLQPLVLDSFPAPDVAVPDDVAGAVKRALLAIENASTNQVAMPEMHLAPITLPALALPSVTDAAAPSDAFSAAPVEPVANPPTLAADAFAATPAGEATPAPAPLGFAPPTLAMRAEAVYERAVTAQVDPSVVAEAIVGDVTASHPEPGKASVVFVDDDVTAKSERRGALRRLIGSLRNND